MMAVQKAALTVDLKVVVKVESMAVDWDHC